MLCYFFLRLENFGVNCPLGFVLGFELTVALVYLNSSGKPSSLLFRKDQRSEKSNEGYSNTVKDSLFVYQVSSYQVFLWQFKIGSSCSSEAGLSDVNMVVNLDK